MIRVRAREMRRPEVIYRCRGCGAEEARGCLPSATCGLYFIGVLALSVGLLAGLVRLIRLRLGQAVASAEEAAAPWWVDVSAYVIGFVLIVACAWAVNFALESAEWLLFARRRCPECGGRRWSRGFTRGFGL